MYNATKPTLDDLPTSKQLLRSTSIAFIAAMAILIAIVLPSEYAIDPTGIGRALGLTEMGEIKTQLAEEAAADAALDAAKVATKGNAGSAMPAQAQSGTPVANDSAWRDEMRVVIKPGQGAEVKLSMKVGEQAEFNWVSEGGVVNFDTHGDGDGDGQSVSYKKGRAAPAGGGVIQAAFSGNHGWFWRNRGDADVTVIVRTRGQYAEMKRVL